RTGAAHIGAVKDVYDGEYNRSSLEDVDGPPDLVHRRRTAPLMSGSGIQHPWLDIRIDAGPSHPGVKLAANGENGIPDLLSFQAFAVHPPEQLIVRINFRAEWVETGGLPVRAGGQNQPMELLQPPAAAHILRRAVRRHKDGGEPIQQPCVRRLLPVLAKVRWGAYDPVPEVVLP